MRRLFHFPMSPFSRRTRLALARKGLDVTLCDARANPAFREEAARLVSLRTIPVLVEEDGLALGDSIAISHYLDRAYPDAPPLWPPDAAGAHAALEVATLVDLALNAVIDLGTRYWPLHGDPAWRSVTTETLARAELAFDALPAKAAALPAAWGAGHMCLFTMVAWLEGLPARATQNPMVGQIVSLGYSLPPALERWADAYRTRDDVRALEKV